MSEPRDIPIPEKIKTLSVEVEALLAGTVTPKKLKEIAWLQRKMATLLDLLMRKKVQEK